MIIETTKNDCAVEPFTMDWADVYQQLGLDAVADPITASSWSGAGLTVGADSFTDLITTALISGGTIGTAATLENTIVIASLGYTFCQKFDITIT
jgi:hypothetical protein